MIIKNIKLNNIRSYINEEINLDKGITLLSGDVGSGKSSILLAIDFALFGLRKGHLSGSALLRNGEKSGSAEISFDVDGMEYTIIRNLKRSPLGITQSYGILIDGNREKELSSIELKQFIISLLNYPQDYLTKSKNFIYNYTIYTPQEEMKQILLGEKEYRLDTIRRVFGIDKYKRVKENSKIFLDYLKIKKRETAVVLENYHEKLSEKEEKEKLLERNNKLCANLKKNLENINSNILELTKNIETTERYIKETNDKKKTIELKELDLRYKNITLKKTEEEIKTLEIDIQKLGEETKNELIFEKQEKLEKEALYKKLEEDVNILRLKINEINLKKTNSLSIINNIKKLDKCPTCMQDVSAEYKKNIFSKEDNTIKLLDGELVNLKEKLSFLDNGLKFAREELDNLAKKESQIEIIKIKRKSLKEGLEKIDILREHNYKILEEIKNLREDIASLKSELGNSYEIEKKYDLLKADLNNARGEQKNIEIEKNVRENETLNLKEDFSRLNKEIGYMDEARKKLSRYNELYDFLSNNFVNILDTIERKTMIMVRSDFDVFFQKWFSMLIDDGIIKVRLDEEFTPVIEQAGHEIEYTNLSGGEKTAAALAYRLALNQVINTFVSEIKTKDLLILDEPTDGFSSEQLDKLRNVLNELKTEQIIIVSHESKIESFVDRIIRLEKKEHTTRVV